MEKKKQITQPIRMAPDYGENDINDRLDEMRKEDMKKMAKEVLKVAQTLLTGSIAEKEVEKLLNVILKNSPFRNKVFSVGGYERDRIMDIDSKDLDIAVEQKGGAKAFSKFLHRKFPKETSNPHEMGKGYPIWHIAFKDDVEHDGVVYKTSGAELDIVDTQKEAFPDPESRQRITEYGDKKEDIERRDFTVNMLLRDMTSGEVVDLTGQSVRDIERGVLRGHPGVDPDKMFSDDPLRIMRLVRFHVKYGWDVPMSVLKSAKRVSSRIQIVSNERIRDELVKIMKLGKLGKAVKFMRVIGILKYVLPEIDKMKGVKHDNRSHKEGDVFKHTLEVLKNAKPTIEDQLAALLHDVGKPDSQQILEDKIQFLGHETVSGEMAEAIMRRLKFESKTVKKVRHMVENHMRPHQLEDAKSKALRKFVRDIGEEMVDAVLDLAEADALGNLPPRNYIPDLREKIEEAMSVPMRKEPVLNGKEIMDTLDIKPGKIIGEITRFLDDLEDEYASNNQELTKDIAKKEVIKNFG